MIYLVQLDLTAESRSAIRTRFAESDLRLRREQAGLWHINRPGIGHVASFYLMGTLANGDKVYVVLATSRTVAYLTNKFGARIRTWKAAATDTTARAVLGGISPHAWLLANGATPYTEEVELWPDLVGLPMPPFTTRGADLSGALR